MLCAEGIILEKKEIGEADWRYVALTREMGKIEFVSRGGRKVLARLSGHVEPLTFSSLEFTTTNTLKVIGASGIQHFHHIKEVPVLFQCASDSAAFLHYLLPLQYHDEALFNSFYAYLSDMDAVGAEHTPHDAKFNYHAHMRSHQFLNTCANILGVYPELQYKEDALQLNKGDIRHIIRENISLKNYLKSQF